MKDLQSLCAQERQPAYDIRPDQVMANWRFANLPGRKTWPDARASPRSYCLCVLCVLCGL